MKNLHNHAQSAVLQNGCYSCLTPSVPVVIINQVSGADNNATDKHPVTQYVIIFQSTLWDYESHRRCQSAPQRCSTMHSVTLLHDECNEKNKLGLQVRTPGHKGRQYQTEKGAFRSAPDISKVSHPL